MKRKFKLIQQVSLAILIAGSFTTAGAADAEAGKAKAAVCVGCHGVDGKGLDTPPAAGQPISPRINGQIEGYLVTSIAAYKNGARTDALMGAIAAGLSDDDIANLAAYFASIK